MSLFFKKPNKTETIPLSIQIDNAVIDIIDNTLQIEKIETRLDEYVITFSYGKNEKRLISKSMKKISNESNRDCW